MDTKLHRKSRAPWQASASFKPVKGAPNTYADNASIMPEEPKNTLQVPKTAASKSRKQSRRMSIHQSATTPHFDSSLMPALPGMFRTATNNSDLALMRSYREKEKEEDIVATIKGELRDKGATAIDDFYKSLVGQKAKLDSDLKARINQNQKNILQLTDDLKVTQEELLLLRVLTKELYAILAEFSDAAERRLELEHNEPARDLDQPRKTAPAKKKDRLSVLVLQKMWATELQLLYKHVDGAQKFIQAIPGRHVLAESGRWHEINVGTWKPSNPIHLFLLNDLVLVATRKLPQEGNSKRLQAVHCWPLHTVEIGEITPPGLGKDDTKVYVVNLRAASLSYVYQTDRYDHFMRVMNAYSKGRSELAQKERMYEEASPRAGFEAANGSTASLVDVLEKQLRDSLRHSGMGLPGPEDLPFHRRTKSNRHSDDVVLQDISARVHSRNRSHDFPKAMARVDSRAGNEPARLFSELKTTEDKLDEVDVHLAHSEYMSAVGLIKHIESKVSSVVTKIPGSKTEGAAEELRLLVDVVKLKINNRKIKVQQGLLFDLHYNIATLTTDEITNIVEFYGSFDKLGEGLAAFLDAMSAHLSRTVGKLISNAHGSTRVDIVNYLANLTIVYVLIIRRAVLIHKQSIEPILRRGEHGNVDSSAFVTWCVSEVSLLVESMKKHATGTLLLHDADRWLVKDPKYYEELVLVVRPQLALLKREGLNVDYLFHDIFSGLQ